MGVISCQCFLPHRVGRAPIVSPVRDEQKLETRSRILDAATTHFADSGNGGASLEKSADLAGVSVESLKASGFKRDLLFALFERSFSGLESGESIANYESVAEITADQDNDRYLAGFVHFVAESNRRSSHLWVTLLSGWRLIWFFVFGLVLCGCADPQTCLCLSMNCGDVALRPPLLLASRWDLVPPFA